MWYTEMNSIIIYTTKSSTKQHNGYRKEQKQMRLSRIGGKKNYDGLSCSPPLVTHTHTAYSSTLICECLHVVSFIAFNHSFNTRTYFDFAGINKTFIHGCS